MNGLFYWQRIILAIIALVVSTFLFNHASDISSSWFWAWLAPVPLIFFAYYASFFESFLMLLVMFLLGSISYIEVYTSFFKNDLFLINAIYNTGFAAAIAMTGVIVRKLRAWPTVFLLPAVWVGKEYLQGVVTGMGTLGDLAYSQVGFLPLLQVAKFTGFWGVSFVTVLAANTIVMSFFLRNKPRHRFLVWIVPLILFMVLMAYGMESISEPELVNRVHVGMISLPLRAQTDSYTKKVDDYDRLLSRLDSRHLDVVVFPEETFKVSSKTWEALLARLSSMAKKHHVSIITGVGQHSAGKISNAAWVISAEGRLQGVYYKRAFLPGAQGDFLVGQHNLILHRASGRWGVVLCTDMDFRNLAREYSLAKVGLMFVLGEEKSTVQAEIQSESAIFRGVENNYAVVRVSKSGDLMASDNHGRLLAYAKIHANRATMLTTFIALGGGNTFYAVCGDWFAFVCLGLVLIFCLWAFAPEIFGAHDHNRGQHE